MELLSISKIGQCFWGEKATWQSEVVDGRRIRLQHSCSGDEKRETKRYDSRFSASQLVSLVISNNLVTLSLYFPALAASVMAMRSVNAADFTSASTLTLRLLSASILMEPNLRGVDFFFFSPDWTNDRTFPLSDDFCFTTTSSFSGVELTNPTGMITLSLSDT